MSVSKKEYEAFSKDADRYLAFARRLEPVIRALLWPILRSRFLRRRLETSTGARIGQISHLAEQGQHGPAATLALETLLDIRQRRKTGRVRLFSDHWWFVARQAAESLDQSEDREGRATLLALSEAEDLPRGDFDAAACFLAFAHWAYDDRAWDDALALAERAASIDKTWGEPAFILGWYRLVLGGGDPLEAFMEAVRREPDMLFRIAGDPECRRHPHILQRLKAATGEALVAAGKPRPA